MFDPSLSILRTNLEAVQMSCALIVQGEDDQREVKASFEIEALNSLAAFSNILGVPETGDYQTIKEQDTTQ